jgi:hypothetical protein
MATASCWVGACSEARGGVDGFGDVELGLGAGPGVAVGVGAGGAACGGADVGAARGAGGLARSRADDGVGAGAGALVRSGAEVGAGPRGAACSGADVGASAAVEPGAAYGGGALTDADRTALASEGVAPRGSVAVAFACVAATARRLPAFWLALCAVTDRAGDNASSPNIDATSIEVPGVRQPVRRPTRPTRVRVRRLSTTARVCTHTTVASCAHHHAAPAPTRRAEVLYMLSGSRDQSRYTGRQRRESLPTRPDRPRSWQQRNILTSHRFDQHGPREARHPGVIQ